MADVPDSERQRRRRESGEAHAAAAMEAAAEMITMWDKDNSGQRAGAPSGAVTEAQPAAEAGQGGADGAGAAEAGVQAASADRQEPDDVTIDTATNDNEDDEDEDEDDNDGDARANSSLAKSEEEADGGDARAGSDSEGSGVEEGSSDEGDGEGAEEGAASEDEAPPAPSTPEHQSPLEPHLEDHEDAADDELTSSTAAPPSPSPSPHSRASATIKLVTGAGTSQLLAADPALQFPPSPAKRRGGGRGGAMGGEDGDGDGSSGQGVLGHTPSPSPPPSPITSPLHSAPVAMTSGKPPQARRSSASEGKPGEEVAAAGTGAGEAEAKVKGKDEAIRVIVRVRPANARELRGEEEVVAVAGCEVSLPFKRRLMTSRYDCVLGPAASQGDVYEQLRAPIAGVLRGMNCTIFAYGQTGTGKTHTMLGRAAEGRLAEDAGLLQATPEEEWGVIPRAVAQVFGVVAARGEGGGAGEEEEVASTGVVTCSYIQIYNHKLYDLLHDVSGQRALAIREAPGDGDSVYVAGLSEVRVGSVEDVMALLHIGNKHRRVRATECNEHSSRSHAVLQLSVATESRKPGARRTVIRRAKLNLVDLAGSEKWNTSSSEAMQADRAKELAAINKSLSALGNCIAALTDGTRQHIPYRDSPLTRLLQDSLGGNTRTVVVATISPSSGSAEETVSTLKFADRARQVMARVRVNEVVDDAILLARARREVARLRAVMKLQAAGCTCGLCECGFAQAGAAGRRLAMGSRALSRSGSSMRLLRTPGSSRSGSRGSRGTRSRAGAVVGGVRSLQRMQQQSRGKAGSGRAGGSSSKRPPRSSTSSAGTAGGATSPGAGSGGGRQVRRRVGRSPVRLQGGDERQTHSGQRAQRYLEQQRDGSGQALEGDDGGGEEADRGEDAGNPPLAPRRSEVKAKCDKPAASAKESGSRKEGGAGGGLVVSAKQLKGLRQQISNLTEHSMELVQLLEAEEGKVASLQADKVHLQQQLSQVEAKVKAKASEEVQQASEQREEMARELRLRERRVEELEEEVRQWQAKVAQQAVSVRSRHAPSPSPTTSSPPPPAAAPAPAVPVHRSPAARTPVKTYAGSSSSVTRGSPVKSYSPPSVTQLPQPQPQPSQATSPQPAQVITSPAKHKHSPELQQAKATSGGVGYYSNALVNLSIGNSGKAAGTSSASPSPSAPASAAPAGFGPVAAQAYNSYLASLGTSGLGITDPYIASLVSGHMGNSGSSSAGGMQQSAGGYTTPSHGYGAAVDNLLGPGLGMGGYGSYGSTGYGGSYGAGVSSGLGGGADQGAGSVARASAMLNSSSLTSPFGYSPALAATSSAAHAAPHASPSTSSSAAAAAAAASVGLASFTSPSAASYLSASASFPTLPSVQPQPAHQGRGMPSSSSAGSLHSAATSHAQLSHAVPSLYSAGALTALPSSHSTSGMGMGMGGMPSSSFEDSSVRAGITYLDDDLSASQRHAVAAAGSSPSRYGSAKYRQPSAYAAASSPPRRQQQAAFTAQSPGFGYRQGGGDSQLAASPPRRTRHRSSGSQSSGGRSGGRNAGRARARGARPPAGRASAAERREARLKKADRNSLVSNALTAASRRLR